MIVYGSQAEPSIGEGGGVGYFVDDLFMPDNDFKLHIKSFRVVIYVLIARINLVFL